MSQSAIMSRPVIVTTQQETVMTVRMNPYEKHFGL